jgi:Predicted thioesterase
MKEILTAEIEIRVRFNEVDSMGIAWHGSYALYFEDAREAFGRAYGLEYLSVKNQGYYIPLVDLSFSYKLPLVYGNTAIVEISYQPSEAAKICFSYRILSSDRQHLIATGKSVQVFMDEDRKLVLYLPEFYVAWQKKHGQIENLPS